jgi:hypothetical protein
MYASVIHQNGKYAFGLRYYDLVLKRHSMVFKDYFALKESDTEQYDKEVQELIVYMLILKGSNHGSARTVLQQQYAFGTMTDDLYPTTEEKVISLLDTFARNNNNNGDNNNIINSDNHDAVVAAHDASQEFYSDMMMMVLMTNHLYPMLVKNRRRTMPHFWLISTRVLLTKLDSEP